MRTHLMDQRHIRGVEGALRAAVEQYVLDSVAALA